MSLADRGDIVLEIVLAALSDEDQTRQTFSAAQVERAIRREIDPPPARDEIEDALQLLALPMLGGVVKVGTNEYRIGAPADVVDARLRRLVDLVYANDRLA